MRTFFVVEMQQITLQEISRAVVKPVSYVFDDPVEALDQINTSDCTAGPDFPVVRFDPGQIQGLGTETSFGEIVRMARKLASLISRSDKEPFMSCLFASTRREAPDNR
jgi:hypothetical protein